MTEKIQHTAAEWVQLIDDLDWNPDAIIDLKERGYIIQGETMTEKDCSTCNGDVVNNKCNNCDPKTKSQWQPRGEIMTEKIQMTEEQFENIYSFFHNTNFNEGYTATLHLLLIVSHLAYLPLLLKNNLFVHLIADNKRHKKHLLFLSYWNKHF